MITPVKVPETPIILTRPGHDNDDQVDDNTEKMDEMKLSPTPTVVDDVDQQQCDETTTDQQHVVAASLLSGEVADKSLNDVPVATLVTTA